MGGDLEIFLLSIGIGREIVVLTNQVARTALQEDFYAILRLCQR